MKAEDLKALVIQCPECGDDHVRLDYEIERQRFRGECKGCGEVWVCYDLRKEICGVS